MADKEHLLALRVMRLTKPSLLPSATDTLSLCHHDCGRKTPEEGFGPLKEGSPPIMEQLLSLPQSFGNIFLGETFVSYISVHNDYSQDAKEVIVKADLQTGSQRINLIQLPTRDRLQPGNSIDDVMRHEVKELGTHILVCGVSYKNTSGAQSFFRKFFKFQVLKPLDVKTKFYNIEPRKIFLEAQIQNLTNSTMCVEKVNLEPSNSYGVLPLNKVDGKGSTFSSQRYLKPKDTRQYLYQLDMKESVSKPQEKCSIGKLDIVWKTGLGERGRLQTSQLQRPILNHSEIRVGVTKIPGVVKAMKSFLMICQVTNCSERPKNFQVTFENHTNMLWQRVSGYTLDKLDPRSSTEVTFKLLPATPGLLGVTGLRIIDTEIDRTYQFDYIHYVLVHPDG